MPNEELPFCASLGFLLHKPVFTATWRAAAVRTENHLKSDRTGFNTPNSRSKAMQRPYSTNQRHFGDYNHRKYMISGITLAVITGFRRLASNSVVSEMLKHLPNNNLQVSGNCWRNTPQHEIDYLETEGKELRAWEITFNPNARFRFPLLFKPLTASNLP